MSVDVAKKASSTEELPADNAARIAIYDALPDHGYRGLSVDELFDGVIGRLRVLVPRELFVRGERSYVLDKIQICVEAGLVRPVETAPDLLARTDVRPRIRYPDGTIRDYVSGLEAAKERLEAADAKLRQSRHFDVHHLAPSISDDQGSDAFRVLVASMREHGYLDQFPVSNDADGRVVDGRARIAAAEVANVTMLKQHSIPVPARRDTPLNRVLLVLDANWARMADQDRERVYEAVATEVGRSWASIEDDLALTRAWRATEPRPYVARFDVTKVKFRPDDPPKIQVTRDGTKVMLRSLLEAVGLASYKYELLGPYVAMEDAKTAFSGRPAIFVGIAESIDGIANMQRERRKKGRKTDREWNDIRAWLLANYGTSDANGDTEDSEGVVQNASAASARDPD